MSQDHFQGRFEVEFKYRIPARAPLLARLHALGCETMLEDNREEDCYFDYPDGSLARADQSLCIRTMSPSGIKLLILKGPGADRCEATRIEDADKACSIFIALGYRPWLRLTKLRSIYFLGPYHITLDSLAGLGEFAEIAIMTDHEADLPRLRGELLALAARLELDPAWQETGSYRSLWVSLAARDPAPSPSNQTSPQEIT